MIRGEKSGIAATHAGWFARYRRHACIALLSVCAFAPASAEENAEELNDAFVSLAIRSALLDRAEPIRELAAAQQTWERENKPEATFAENLATLATVTERIVSTNEVPSRRELRASMRGYTRDGNVETLERLLERLHPDDRLADAAASRRYESRRQVVNSITGAVASAFQLQFFGLIQPPLDAVDYVLVKRHYLSPEERRELAVAEEIIESGASNRRADRVAQRQAPRLNRTYALHARRNAEEAHKRGRMLEAAWWYDHEQDLRGWDEPNRGRHVETIEQLQYESARREQAVGIASAIRDIPTDIERATIRAVLSSEFPARSDWETISRQERIAIRAAIDPNMRRRLMRIEQLGREGNGPWREIGRDMAARPEENPQRAMNEAKRTARRRIQGWLLSGSDPREIGQSLSPEEARQVESAWIQSARSAFVFDAITRTLTYPLLPGRLFSRQEIIEAAHRVPDSWEGTREANRSFREGARALRKDRRFERAAVFAEAAGRESQADSLRNRQARAMRREIRRSEDPAERHRIASRLMNAHPEFADQRGIAQVRQTEEQLADALFVVTRRDLRRNDPLTAIEALAVPDEFLDGRNRNGEIGNRGVFVLPGDRIAWIDRGTDEVMIDPRPTENLMTAYARWIALQRTGDVREVLERPRERKRIPIALEGSAMPGFYIAPGLVPLEPDLEMRRLYE